MDHERHFHNYSNILGNHGRKERKFKNENSKIRRKKGILKALPYCLHTTETMQEMCVIIPTTMGIREENEEKEKKKKRKKDFCGKYSYFLNS